ncbi:MAG: N-acetylmuramoyl-L-alanine amidase [Chloroflexi bacterium]|nr:N-acetylmuramoyl-L-alanine amidase [Chloroflexota bacterium]
MQRLLLLVSLLAAAAAGFSVWSSARAGEGPAWLQVIFGPRQTLAGRRIGIVAGHSGNDSGAVCPDGLTEASVNAAVAEAVVRGLKSRGAAVDLLNEFDSRLRGYAADAFVSIHADSCGVDLSGFKVASLEGGSKASEPLAACLWERYETATGLARHPDTITYDMRGYHAFREIALATPAAIIEIGFLKADRDLLTKRPDRAAAGIVAGVECFLAAKK